MLYSFKKIYNYKINDFEKDEIVRVRMGNLISFLSFFISCLYSFLYLFYYESFISFLITQVFAFSYLFYFYFLSKLGVIKARLFLFTLAYIQLFIITVFLISSKSGVQYYYLLVLPAAYFLFNKDKKLRLLLSLIALILLIVCHFLGESYYILESTQRILDTIYIISLVIIFSVFIILFNTSLEELKMKEDKLKYLSKTDYLTKILNRRAFYKKAEEMIIFSNRYESELGLLLFDIDHFKKINDTYGHNVGDLVLQRLSKEVEASIRNSDCFARFGGEEFILLVPNTSKEELSIFAEKIRVLIQNIEVKNDKKETVKITISIGGTVYNKNESIESFINRADISMYESKNKGRNTVSFNFSKK